MSHVNLPQDFSPVFSKGSPAPSYQTDFFFDIPSVVTLPSCRAHTHQLLPPSISILGEPSPPDPEYPAGATAGTSDITYWIEARIVTGDKVIKTVRRDIVLASTAETPPPIDSGGLREEYQLAATSSAGSSWEWEKYFEVTIRSKEPRPIVLPAMQRNGPVSTEILLDVSTQSMYGGNLDDNMLEPPFMECEVTVALEAISYFGLQETERMMSVAEIRTNPYAVLQKQKSKPQKRKLTLTGWKRVGSAASGIVEWKATASLKTALPDDLPLLPSFLSTLVSRRYAFDVICEIDSKEGVSGSPMHLCVPVQMVYAPIGVALEGKATQVAFEAALEAPAYVPAYVC